MNSEDEISEQNPGERRSADRSPLMRRRSDRSWSCNTTNAGDMEPRAGRRSTDGGGADIYERRWRVWKAFLERPSAATLLGAFLLVGMFVYIALVTTLGSGPVPSLVGNAFLLILGYFFGQGACSGKH